jgi:hypothetical protein
MVQVGPSVHTHRPQHPSLIDTKVHIASQNIPGVAVFNRAESATSMKNQWSQKGGHNVFYIVKKYFSLGEAIILGKE